MLLGMKKEAPACCDSLFAEVMILPSVYVKCRQSRILGRRGFMYEFMLIVNLLLNTDFKKDHVCPDAEVQISFSNY
eukprot:504876-Pelagomonas_calceolata.AAC.1